MKPYDFGNKLLIEDTQKLTISDLLAKYRREFKAALLSTHFAHDGGGIELTTSHTGFNGERFWFKCPICSRRVATLYKHPLIPIIACRHCLELRYKESRYKKMIELDVPE